MKKPLLVLDCNGLCWRAFHSMGGLSYNSTPTGIAFGFFGELLRLQSHFETDRVVFAFDRGQSLRSKLCKEYKYTRFKQRKDDPRVKELYAKASMQINLLRKEYLPMIGFRNVFSQKGYEADDIIASVCHNLSADDSAVVVSSDKDMFQLLSKRVRVWRPKEKELWTVKRFKKEYGISPLSWIMVKALAGCPSDEVKGIKGIGEKTAIRYIKRELPFGAKFKLLEKESFETAKRNGPLVQLPFEGCKVFKLRKDRKLDYQKCYKKLNIQSLNDPTQEIIYKE